MGAGQPARSRSSPDVTWGRARTPSAMVNGGRVRAAPPGTSRLDRRIGLDEPRRPDRGHEGLRLWDSYETAEAGLWCSPDPSPLHSKPFSNPLPDSYLLFLCAQNVMVDPCRTTEPFETEHWLRGDVEAESAGCRRRRFSHPAWGCPDDHHRRRGHRAGHALGPPRRMPAASSRSPEMRQRHGGAR